MATPATTASAVATQAAIISAPSLTRMASPNIAYRDHRHAGRQREDLKGRNGERQDDAGGGRGADERRARHHRNAAMEPAVEPPPDWTELVGGPSQPL
jgi:hypothetical protein